MSFGSYFFSFLVFLGFIYSIRPFFGFLNFIYRSFGRGCFQARNHTYRAYGSPSGGSWAVVTGGSDGIGLAICWNLARQGFNICIVSRNEQKIKKALEAMSNEMMSKNSAFETRCVVADFAQIYTIKEYQEKLKATNHPKFTFLHSQWKCINYVRITQDCYI